MNDPIKALADEAITFHRVCFDAAIEGQRGFQKQLDTVFDVTREILAFQRDQQVAWTRLFTDRHAPSASS
jgi:hypothetical protein